MKKYIFAGAILISGSLLCADRPTIKSLDQAFRLQLQVAVITNNSDLFKSQIERLATTYPHEFLQLMGHYHLNGSVAGVIRAQTQTRELEYTQKCNEVFMRCLLSFLGKRAIASTATTASEFPEIQSQQKTSPAITQTHEMLPSKEIARPFRWQKMGVLLGATALTTYLATKIYRWLKPTKTDDTHRAKDDKTN